MTEMTELHGNVNEKALLKEAESLLLRYGGDFLPMIVTKAQGVYVDGTEGESSWTSLLARFRVSSALETQKSSTQSWFMLSSLTIYTVE